MHGDLTATARRRVPTRSRRAPADARHGTRNQTRRAPGEGMSGTRMAPRPGGSQRAQAARCWLERPSRRRKRSQHIHCCRRAGNAFQRRPEALVDWRGQQPYARTSLLIPVRLAPRLARRGKWAADVVQGAAAAQASRGAVRGVSVSANAAGHERRDVANAGMPEGKRARSHVMESSRASRSRAAQQSSSTT